MFKFLDFVFKKSVHYQRKKPLGPWMIFSYLFHFHHGFYRCIRRWQTANQLLGSKIELTTKWKDRSTFIIEDSIHSLSIKCYVYTLYINSCLIHSTFNIGFLMRLFHQQFFIIDTKKTAPPTFPMEVFLWQKTAPRGPENWKTTSDIFFRRTSVISSNLAPKRRFVGDFCVKFFF